MTTDSWMSVTGPRRFRRVWTQRRAGVAELALLSAMYLAYSASRLFADDDLTLARVRATHIVEWEQSVGLDRELAVSHWFAARDTFGMVASFYYAAAHYLVTAAVLLVLHRRRRALYSRVRWALVVSTLIALVMYLLVPTAPPRLAELGYVDVLAEHASSGWWGTDASAPRGLGGMTNELAAMPSMHAGWALWVAIVTLLATRRLLLRSLACAHAVLTAVVVVGTGNHWTLDVIVGWCVVAVGVLAVWPGGAGRRRHVSRGDGPAVRGSAAPRAEQCWPAAAGPRARGGGVAPRPGAAYAEEPREQRIPRPRRAGAVRPPPRCWGPSGAHWVDPTVASAPRCPPPSAVASATDGPSPPGEPRPRQRA